MKKYIFLLIILSFFHSAHGQQHQHPSHEQMVQEAFAKLPLLRAELAKPVGRNNHQEQPATPNQQNIDAYKQRLRGPAFDRLATTVLSGQERLHVQRTVQETIAQVSLATAAAQNAALEERLVQKVDSLTQVQENCAEAEGQLDTLQKIKHAQEQQKQKTADYAKACKDLQFLGEVKALDEKLSQLASHLSRLDLELTGEIIAAQKIVSELRRSQA